MDSRYLISNCKDQSIKLWDIRRFASESTIQNSRTVSNAINRAWDYRAGAQPQTRKIKDFFASIIEFYRFVLVQRH
ncbi:unnamed protein product, partial [Rotaria magnacalcarata]